jgi:hypothetical protein
MGVGHRLQRKSTMSQLPPEEPPYAPLSARHASYVLRALAQALLAAGVMLASIMVIEWLPTYPGEQPAFPAGYLPALFPLLAASAVLWVKSRQTEQELTAR